MRSEFPVLYQQMQIRHRIVGRQSELRGLWACLSAHRHVLLEGPVGVGKTVLARAVADVLGRGVTRVDGDGRYSEQKLVGHFDPPTLLRLGYGRDAFMPGPLVAAMELGQVLLLNELNRMPEGVQNVLLPALDEGCIMIPQLGAVTAAPGFTVVATMNPREFVATGHLSEALLDRFERIELIPQTEAEESEIVRLHVRLEHPDEHLIRAAVNVVRTTRVHPGIRRGASVRAAIAIVEIADALGGIEHLAEAIRYALPTRIEWKEPSDQPWDSLATELVPEKKSSRPTPIGESSAHRHNGLR